jgi:integrase
VKGDGGVYKRGNVYWVQYTQNGRTIKMSAKTGDKDIAKKRLRALVLKSRTDDNFFASLLPGRATIEELVLDLFSHYRTVKLKPKFADECEMRWNKHLLSVFGEMQADRLSSADVLSYRTARAEAGAAPATINRELQIIHASLVMGSEQEPPKVQRVPKFSWAPENNARKVFIDKNVMDQLKQAAAQRSLEARTWVEMAFTYGWRKSDFKRLTTRSISLADGTVRLETSKNGEPREVPITNELRVLLTALVVGRESNDPLFHFSFIKEWKAICKIAGVTPGKRGITPHDMRRSSARNKRASGVDTSVIMQIQGWKSDKMFRRYAIVDRGDMMRAFEQEKVVVGGQA